MNRFLLALTISASLAAQEIATTIPTTEQRLNGTGAPSFPHRDYFRYIMQTEAPRIQLQTPGRLGDFVVGSDHIELKLHDYLELVLQNNTDILIQKVQLEVPRNAVLRGFGVFDPVVSGSFTSTRAKTPTNDVLAGATSLSTLTQPVNVNFRQTIETGATINGFYNASKFSTNNSFATFNPSLNSSGGISFSQPLLRDRGSFYSKLPIIIAKSSLKQQEFLFEDQVQRLLSTAETAYWDVVSARENLRVQEKALAFADTALRRARRELEIGASSPLDIFQPEQNYATIQIQVTRARFTLDQAVDALRRQASLDLDTRLRTLPIVLTEPIDTLEDGKNDREELVSQALQRRPDLRANRQLLDVDRLNVRSSINRLRPFLALTGQYSIAGRGGTLLTRQTVFNPDGTSSPLINVTPGGFGDALSQMFGFGFPTYGFGLTFQLPIKDRRAAADLADAKVNQKIDAYTVRTTEQRIRLGVLQADTQVQSSRESVRLAEVALDYARKRVDAEQKKYDLGTSTIFFLLAAQNDLTQAEASLINAKIQFRRDLLNLNLLVGDLPEKRGLVIQP